MYTVKEIYYTLQGEGIHTGRAAVFCRFSGCNLWSGREQERADAACDFCDTDFRGSDGPGGGRFATPAELARAVAACWPSRSPLWKRRGNYGRPLVVCTGGEPLLQLDAALVNALHAKGFAVALETNGTLPVPEDVDWICVSPKGRTELVVRRGDELKLVYPQADALPERFAGLDFEYFLLQPMDGPRQEYNTRLALEYCLAHPLWRLSLQTHKYLRIP